VVDILEPKQPCFVLFRTDKKNGDNKYLWYMLCYVPDDSIVRNKMLYASVRQSLRSDLGQNYFIDDIHGTDKKEFSAQGFKQYFVAKTSEVPLSEQERMRKEEREIEANTVIDMISNATVTQGAAVSFPVDEKIYQAVDSLKNGHINYIRLVIKDEVIMLDHSAQVNEEDLSNQIPKSDCAFHFFNSGRWTRG